MRDLICEEMEITRGNEKVEVIVEGYVNWYEDTKYGEDCEGNRGCYRAFVRDIEDITAVYAEDYTDCPLTVNEVEEAAEILTQKFFLG